MSKIKWDGSIGETEDGYYAHPDSNYGWRVSAANGIIIIGFAKRRIDIDVVIERDRALTQMIEREQESAAETAEPAGDALPLRAKHAQQAILTSEPHPHGGWKVGDEVWLRGAIDEVQPNGVKAWIILAPGYCATMKIDSLYRAIPVVDDTGLLSDLDDDAKARVRADAADMKAQIDDAPLTLDEYQRQAARTIGEDRGRETLAIFALGLVGEVGEMRYAIENSAGDEIVTEEIGDAIWYPCALLTLLGGKASVRSNKAFNGAYEQEPPYEHVWDVLDNAVSRVCEGVKKICGHGHGLKGDTAEIVRREAGKALRCLEIITTSCGLDFSDVLQSNLDKIELRYPDGFSVEASIARADVADDHADAVHGEDI